jgi:Ca-activated chloride channel family protein
LKKKENSNSNDIKLKVSYKDRNDKSYNNEQNVTFDNTGEYYDNTGIRKAIILTRYANVLKDWILYERSDDKKFIITSETGISDCGYSPDEVYRILGENERTSVALTVSSEYKKIFEEIKQYIQNENKSIQDNNLEQEIKLLNTLIEYK